MLSASPVPPMSPPEPSTRWFRSRRYDLSLTLGVFVLALTLGSIGLISTEAFLWVLFVDVWLIAHPHLTAMYTRIGFDRKSARRYWFLLVGLLPCVVAATAALTWIGGLDILLCVYFFWAAWHYSRQSFGIGRAVGGRSVREGDALTTAVVFVFPVWGLLTRCDQGPELFLGTPIYLPEMPKWVATGAGLAAIALLAAWAGKRWQALRRGAPLLTHTLFLLTHVVVTVVSYVAVEDISEGWLFINIWHNAQYTVFVWAFNARRFAHGHDEEAPFLSRLSQPQNVLKFAAVCLVLGTLYYLGIEGLTYVLEPYFLSVVLVTHMGLNFHHYMVDAVIWKKPKAHHA